MLTHLARHSFLYLLHLRTGPFREFLVCLYDPVESEVRRPDSLDRHMRRVFTLAWPVEVCGGEFSAKPGDLSDSLRKRHMNQHRAIFLLLHFSEYLNDVGHFQILMIGFT